MLAVTRKAGSPRERAAASAELLRSGALGRRLANLASLAAAAHMAQSAEQIVRSAAQVRSAGETRAARPGAAIP